MKARTRFRFLLESMRLPIAPRRTLPRLLPLVGPAVLLIAQSAPVVASRGDAVSYAETYWYPYNSCWPDFSDSGGDCVNFVSQVLHKGGLDPNYTSPPPHWYCHSKQVFSPAWVHTDRLYEYLTTATFSGSGRQLGRDLGSQIMGRIQSGGARGDIILYRFPYTWPQRLGGDRWHHVEPEHEAAHDIPEDQGQRLDHPLSRRK